MSPVVRLRAVRLLRVVSAVLVGVGVAVALPACGNKKKDAAIERLDKRLTTLETQVKKLSRRVSQLQKKRKPRRRRPRRPPAPRPSASVQPSP